VRAIGPPNIERASHADNHRKDRSVKVSEDKVRRIQARVWILIYGGLISLGLGLAIRRTDDAMGSWVALVGALLIVGGVVLIWVRSRMQT
jgi:undecaprenyl pyrophosphate phosphatase UppP